MTTFNADLLNVLTLSTHMVDCFFLIQIVVLLSHKQNETQTLVAYTKQDEGSRCLFTETILYNTDAVLARAT